MAYLACFTAALKRKWQLLVLLDRPSGLRANRRYEKTLDILVVDGERREPAGYYLAHSGGAQAWSGSGYDDRDRLAVLFSRPIICACWMKRIRAGKKSTTFI